MPSRVLLWGQRSDARSLSWLAAIFAFVIFALLLIALVSAGALSAMRAYVGGESLWSKGQKLAVHALRVYASSGDEADWRTFENAIAVPLADRRAREELDRARPDMRIVRDGFEGGRNHPDDVLKMAWLFRLGRHAPYMERAIAIWTSGDEQIGALRSLAERLHTVRRESGSEREQRALLLQIDELNARLSVLEDNFSYTLGMGARWIERIVLLVVIFSAVALLVVGVALSSRLLGDVRATHARHRDLMETARDAIFVCDAADGRILEANRSAAELAGIPAARLVGLPLLDLHPASERSRLHGIVTGAREPEPDEEAHILTADGGQVPVELRASVTVTGRLRVVQVCCRDVSARRAAEQALREREQQLREAQKMEAVGRLAGGVAHDFNNLLTAIMGYSSMIVSRHPRGHDAHEAGTQIQRAAQRAAALTRQLLAFSRRQVLEMRIMDLDQLIVEMEPMLRQLVGEDIQLLCVRSPDLPAIRADRAQLEHVLVNLVVNARDAMVGGGVLRIETSSVTIAGAAALATEVRLVVRDNGCGMDETTRAHAFEPFYTTKELGRGTGLGLATVLGIVQQSGGRIEVESTLGEGSAFTIRLPAIDEPVAPERVEPSASDGPGTSARVLLAEDEPAVRELARLALARAGFEVVSAIDGEEALRLAADDPAPLDLLVTDVIMPRMNGRQLADTLARQRPGLRVLFMSGHAANDIMQRAGLGEGERFLQKPFLPVQLVARAREALLAAPYASLATGEDRERARKA